MSREVHVRFCEHVGVRFPCVTRPIAFFMALKFGLEPRSAEAKRTIREWLQDQLDAQDDPGQVAVSQWLRFKAIQYLADKILSKRYEKWLDEQIDRPTHAYTQ